MTGLFIIYGYLLLRYKPSSFYFLPIFIFNKRESQMCQSFTNSWKAVWIYDAANKYNDFLIFQHYY